MIKVHYEAKNHELTIEGHAESSENGTEDIICASISTLFFTLGQCLEDSVPLLIGEEFDYEFNSGEGRCQFNPKEEYKGHMERVMWTILEGINLIAENYPDFVEFSYAEVDG